MCVRMPKERWLGGGGNTTRHLYLSVKMHKIYYPPFWRAPNARSNNRYARPVGGGVVDDGRGMAMRHDTHAIVWTRKMLKNKSNPIETSTSHRARVHSNLFGERSRLTPRPVAIATHLESYQILGAT